LAERSANIDRLPDISPQQHVGPPGTVNETKANSGATALFDYQTMSQVQFITRADVANLDFGREMTAEHQVERPVELSRIGSVTANVWAV
jgi:hypothetical protein